MHIVKLFALLGLVTTAACADDHTPLEFTLSGGDIVARGEIDGDTLDNFEDIIAEYPEAKTLVLHYIGGSVDDEANVEFARLVRELGFSTLVPSDGLVASGGTDLFLAGVQRELEEGACVGVHSWAGEDYTATDISRDDPEHDRYLDYYRDLDIDEEFYWYTIDAAPAEGMHWMTPAEVAKFGVSTNSPAALGGPEICDAR